MKQAAPGKGLGRLSNVENRVRILSPGQTPGMLTSVTTNGVFRKPIGRSNQGSNNNSKVPRWG